MSIAEIKLLLQKVKQKEMKIEKEYIRKLECPTFNLLIKVLKRANRKKVERKISQRKQDYFSEVKGISTVL